MRKSLIIFFLFSNFLPQSTWSQSYHDAFYPVRLRVNVIFAGNATQQFVYLDSMVEEPQWGGSRINLTDSFNYGEYCFRLLSPDGQLLYSKGFSSLFYEWRTTEEAQRTSRAYTASLTMPMPKNEARLEVYERLKKTGEWELLFTTQVQPSDKQIQQEKPNTFAVTQLLYNGDPAKKADIVFIAEGYTAAQMDKFRNDAARFSEYLFAFEPFSSRRNDFNIWTVEAISNESGPDIPQEGIWKNTVADASFYTFGIDRYLTTPDHKKLCELAWNVPYDAIYVLVNTNKYGGGGIYNFYALSMTDHYLAKEVFIHEFGHSFAGLGDEYYTSEVAYENFYNLETEPWEPNLTTLVNFDEKWSELVLKGTPIPTPNEPAFANTIGVFEGGGYMTKGVFRPALDCRMKSNSSTGFCPVCQRAINRMIDNYCQ